jgi:hypothetical protein
MLRMNFFTAKDAKKVTPEFKRVIFTNDRKERFESETPNPRVSAQSASSAFHSF